MIVGPDQLSYERMRSHSLADLLRRTAARCPDKIAVIDGDISFTFGGLDAAVTSTAGALSRSGLRKGDRLAVLSRNCWQFVVMNFAAARLGVILVPINFMLTAAEIGFILQHSGSTAVVSGQELAETAQEALRLENIDVVLRGWIGNGSPPDGWQSVDNWIRSDHDLVAAIVADDEPVRIMYTSGTESRPKGVMLSSRALLAQYASAIIDGGMSRHDIDLHCMPMYHCAQLDCFLGPDVYLGATSIILRAPEPEAILTAIEKHCVTKLFAPPTVWISLLQSPHMATRDLSSLRKGYYGASAMPGEVLREIQQRLPHVDLWNFYGQTEMAPLATILPPEDHPDHVGSAGRPVLNVETRVVDEHDNPVPPGTVGEIVHRSPQATLGYWRDPEKSAAAFINGWFHSGDLGVFSAEGRLSIVDRKKDMINTGGENVASREVEETLYAHPDVAEAAVFGLPDPRWVEAVTAVVVARPGATLNAVGLVHHCRDRLAGFKVPKRVILVEAMPKNPSGKILKRDLREMYMHH